MKGFCHPKYYFISLEAMATGKQCSRTMGGQIREMGGLVGSTPACYSSSLGSNPDISQKYKWAT